MQNKIISHKTLSKNISIHPSLYLTISVDYLVNVNLSMGIDCDCDISIGCCQGGLVVGDMNNLIIFKFRESNPESLPPPPVPPSAQAPASQIDHLAKARVREKNC